MSNNLNPKALKAAVDAVFLSADGDAKQIAKAVVKAYLDALAKTPSPEPTKTRITAAVTALAEAGIPPDIQELLIYGSPSLGVSPGALAKALAVPTTPVSTMGVSIDARDTALAKINDIRNSIIGCQTINWSEHIYPLVAALEDAGIEGAGYPASRANVGTMLDRTLAAENEAIGFRAALGKIAAMVDAEDGDLDDAISIATAALAATTEGSTDA